MIIGGGVSALTAAYMLRHRDCLVLEKEPHWGGNAYTMEYQGIPYAAGSAFLSSDRDPAYAFAKELGLEPLPVNNWDGTIIRGEYIADTWGDELDRLPYAPSIREGFKQFKRSMLSVDLRTQASEYLNVPLSKFTDNSPPELRSWWGRSPSRAQSLSQIMRVTDPKILRDLVRKLTKNKRMRLPLPVVFISGREGGRTHRDKPAQRRVSRGTGDDADHLFGNLFGAPGGEQNLSRQNWIHNRFGNFRKLEIAWARLRRQGFEIDVQVTPKSWFGTRPAYCARYPNHPSVGRGNSTAQGVPRCSS